MKKIFGKIIAVCVLLSGISLYGFGKKTIFGIRSQGLNEVRELCGWQKCMFKCDQNRNFGTVAATIQYDRSFRPKQIAQFLFGRQNLRFSGSMADRQSGDILADYFGLPPSFSSKIHVSPRISDVVVDFNIFQAFDAKLPGFFIMFHIPVVHTKWNLNMIESAIKPGTAFYPAGYMSDMRINATDLPKSVTQALQGRVTFGDMQDPLQYGKINGRQESNRVAEVQGTLGYNYNAPWYHAGVSFRFGAPTGTITNAEFLFEDIVGNRHHWDIGLGLSGHVNMWENKQKGKCFAVYLDAHVSHLCASKQKRSFDFIKNGPGSRYILLEQIDVPSQDLKINGQIPGNQYIRKLLPAINQTTFSTKLSIGVQTDIVVKLAYQQDNFELDLGYNFWATSKEKMHWRKQFVNNRFALKGDAQLYGFSANDDTVIIPLNVTQGKSTIFGGQGNGNSNFQNINADNQPAAATLFDGTPLLQLNQADATDLHIIRVQIQGSNPAILLQDSDINNDSGILPRALSNKAFIFFNYIWNNRDDWDPYVGFGISAEVAHTSTEHNSASSQWAVWLKAGLSY
jgi:hypothetical protein